MQCQRGILFTILTLLTIGVSSALFILVVYYFVDLGIQKAENKVFAIVVTAMCVSILLLVYGFWASTCGGKGAKYSLAVIYLVYAFVLLAIGVVLLALKGKIIDAVDDYFTGLAPDAKVRTAFEDEFNCKWNATVEVECKVKFEDMYKSFGIGVAAGLIVLFAILIAGDIVAWKWLCSTWDDDTTGPKANVTTPLTYSW
jgi:hypothetical protein